MVFGAMRDRYAHSWPADELAALEQRMSGELDRLRMKLHGPRSDLGRAAVLIAQSRRRMVGLSNRVLSADQVNAALDTIYQRARKRSRRATNGERLDALHEWRKQTKYLANAIRLTSNGDAGERDLIAKRAEQLADWLGDEHDLGVLAQRVVHDEPLIGALAASRLQRLIERRPEKLRRKALRLGAKVYGRKRSRALGSV